MVQVEVVGGRIHLIPPKGILEKMKPTILSKFDGECCKYIDAHFEMPSSKAKFLVEAVVDDTCEICPTAIEVLSELAAKFENVTVKIYNASHVKPPFNITATPAFRINGKVQFTGIPLDPSRISEYFAEHLKEAYVLTHPKLNWLIERLKKFGETYGYHRTPNNVAFINIIYKLLRNIDLYGYPFCPCRPIRVVEGATQQQIYEMNKDKICPCPHAHIDIKRHGHCLCGLFWSPKKVAEYVKMRLQRYGWIIKEIEIVQKQLEELKKRVVGGGGKRLAESILHRIQDIYLAIPD